MNAGSQGVMVFVTNFLPTGFHRAYTVPVAVNGLDRY